MDRDTIAMDVAADDRLAIQIREALRDRQAAGDRQPQGRAVALTGMAASVLQAGPL